MCMFATLGAAFPTKIMGDLMEVFVFPTYVSTSVSLLSSVVCPTDARIYTSNPSIRVPIPTVSVLIARMNGWFYLLPEHPM